MLLSTVIIKQSENSVLLGCDTVTWYVVPDISKDHTVFISKVIQSKKNCAARDTYIVVLCPICRSRMFPQDIDIHHYTLPEARGPKYKSLPILKVSNLIKG